MSPSTITGMMPGPPGRGLQLSASDYGPPRRLTRMEESRGSDLDLADSEPIAAGSTTTD